MRLTFLGTGTSFGIPVIGCRCAVCRSTDPRDTRTRHGALLELPAGRVLVDTPPELRMQLLSAEVSTIDAVWLTHGHADHLHGIDDLRVFSQRQRMPVDLWSSAAVAAEIEHRFGYVLGGPLQDTAEGTSRPELRSRVFEAGTPFEILGEEFTPISVPHGLIRVHGFRVGSLGYITDAKSLPEEAVEVLRGVRVLVLNALWEGDPHPTHFNVEEAVAAAECIGAEQTYLTHLTHRVHHETLAKRLPPQIQPAFDGLVVELP